MFIRGQSHKVSLHLVDTQGKDIETGTPVVKISKDSGAYAVVDDTPTHVDEDLWEVTLTSDEAGCNEYAIKTTHDLMSGPQFVTNSAWFSSLIEDTDGQWESAIINDMRGVF